jgi:NADH dehydrogenase (ubiquinone) 1 beta subcomplex subunit 10
MIQNAYLEIKSTVVTFNFSEKIVVPNQKDYAWYHQRYRRVPTIDECYTDDPVCQHEAQLQFKRDKY